MELTINLNLTEQTLGMVKALLQAVEGLNLKAVEQQAQEAEKPTEKPAETPKATTPISEEQETATTLSDLRQICTSIAEAGGRDEIKELLNNLGFKKITEIPEEQYNEVYKSLEKIANKIPAPF